MPTRGVNGSSPPSRKTNYHVTFNSVYLGVVDSVDPSKLKQLMEAIKCGTSGNVVLGYRMSGISGSISVDLRQLDNIQSETLSPWWSGSGAIPLTAPANSDLYGYSQLLTLHPDDLPGVTLEDLVFPNACPVTIPGAVKRDGQKEDVWPVEFVVMPSRSALSSDLTNAKPGTVMNA